MPRKQVAHVPGKCNKCGAPSGKFKACAACRERNKIAQDKFYGRTLNPKICEEEGCNEEIPQQSHFCRACAKKRKQDRDRAYKAGERKDDATSKPHRPEPTAPRKPLLSEEEQKQLNAVVSAKDREWHAQFMKEKLGLESAPGQPLASKVVTPPPEVWEKLQREYIPQRDTDKFAWVPCRGDISY
jgi:hypothetical protein